MVADGRLPEVDDIRTAVKNYVKAINKGILKVMSKMGISTLQSYRGAQIFEAVGLGRQVIDQYFTSTPSRVEGIGLDEISAEAQMRHAAGVPARAHPRQSRSRPGRQLPVAA